MVGANIDALSGEKLGWVAGIIDGDGHISVVKKKHSEKYTQYLPVVNVTNTDSRVVVALASLTGVGNIHGYQQRGNRSYTWRWYATSYNDVFSVLSRIIPYLVSKKEKAKIVVGFCGSKLAGVCDNSELYYSKLQELKEEEEKERGR